MNIVREGYRLELTSEPIDLYGIIPTPNLTKQELSLIMSEVKKLLRLEVIVEVEAVKNQVLSPVFLVDNKDGTKRMILNLKSLNQYIVYNHFKMEGVANARDLLLKNSYLASIDLKRLTAR